MCSIYREMKLYHYLQIRLIKPTVKGFLVYMRIMVCNEKSCTLLPSGIWLICILFVSLNFFLFPHGMWVIFFSCVLPLGCEWPTSRCLLARDTARAGKPEPSSKATLRKVWGIWHLPATLETTRWSLASLARSHASLLETRKFRCSCPNTSEMLFAGYGCGSRNESVTKGGWQDERLETGSKYMDVTYEFSIIASHSLFFLQWSIQKTT